MKEVYKGTCCVFIKSGLNPPSFLEFCCTYTQPYMDYYRGYGVTADEKQVRAWYFSVANNHSARLFHGVRETLQGLKIMGLPLAIVSTHPRHLILDKLQEEGINHYFDEIYGMAKIKVDALGSACRKMCVKPSRTCFVGDMISDIRDGNEAGLVTIGIDNGCGTAPYLIDAGAHHCIFRLRQLFYVLYRGIYTPKLLAVTC